MKKPSSPMLQPIPFLGQLQTTLHSIDESADWIKRTRPSAARLDMEADRLLIRLHRSRNKVQSWLDAVGEPAGIGFFGRSQAGKNHLISALMAGENGKLEMDLGGEPLDFLTQINPDNQSAGLVIRFSRQVKPGDPHFPVHLSLLDEAAIGKIMTLAFLEGRQSETGPALPDELAISEHLKKIAPRRLAEPVAGMTSEQVIALWDFLGRHDRQRQRRLAVRFWPAAIDLAPYLAVEDRARLFSLLWEESSELTAFYSHFAQALQSLSCAVTILAPRSVLVNDDWLPADGILNPSRLARLDTAADENIQVRPMLSHGASEPVTLSVAELTLLSVELRVPLLSPARESLFEQVDILDFPGYGGGLDSPANESMRQELALGVLSPFAQAIQRAKSRYLLEYYADRQQNQLLLVCTAAGDRQDAKVISRSLDYWVKQTQGENTQLRAGRKPGLIWALTGFDQRVTQGVNFDEAVQRYVGQPGDSWGTMLAVDELGIKRMASYLSTEMRSDIKLTHIIRQWEELRRELLENLFATWYRPDGIEEPVDKRTIAERLLKTLQTRAGVHGEMLEQLLPTREALTLLYLQQHNAAVNGLTPASHDIGPSSSAATGHFGIGVEIDLFRDTPVSASAPPTSGDLLPVDQPDEKAYAKNVYGYWINHLRSLPDNLSLLALLGMDKPTIELLVQELIIASVRLNIAGALSSVPTDSTPARLSSESQADRQVSQVLTVLGDFVSWLGFQQMDEALRPDSRINTGHKIFTRPEKQAVDWNGANRLTKLTLTPTNTTALYIYDWLVGLHELIMRNAGFSGDEDITAKQRQHLSQILDQIKQEFV
jgi:hypothetical protein